MFGLLFSGNDVKLWASELTMARCGVILYFVAVSRSLGRIIRPNKKVLTTFVVMVDSLSSNTAYLIVDIPAFSTIASRRFNPSAFLANSLTDS